MPSIKIREPILLECIEYMKKLHSGQVRRVTNAPYYIHLLRVLDMMEEAPFFFSTRDKLHDVKEDSPDFSWPEIVQRFGIYVAGAVAMLSKTKLGENNPEIYFSMLRLSNPRIIAIKIMDRIDNTSEFNIISDADWLEKYLNETITLIMPLIEIMVNRGEIESQQEFYHLGVWLEEKLQRNLHGMQTRIRELRSMQNYQS
jgi:(p)ppGpp synthase/HD superfamily hydrolase